MYLVHSVVKKTIQIIALAMFVVSFAGCATAIKTSATANASLQTQSPAPAPAQSISFKAVWVQNTLTEKNSGFRKVNRFSPIYDSRENKVILANSLEGLSTYNLFYTLTPTVENYDRKNAWSKKFAHGFEAPGLVNKGQLFIGGLNGNFYAINVKDGSVAWSFDTGAEIVAEPTLANGYIYFMNAANQLFALDMSSGKQLWVYNRQDTNSLITIRGGSKPSVVGNLVYVGFSDGSLVALNAQTGTPQWETQLNKNTRFKDIDSSPTFSGDNLYINSYDDFLYCLNRTNGTVVWKIKSGGISSPLVIGDRLIYTTSDSGIIAANKSNGQIIWTYKNVSGIATDVLSYKGLVVFGESQGKIKALDLLTGELKAGFDPGRGIMTKPTLIEDDSSFLFVSGEGNLYQVQLTQDSPNKINFIR